MHVLCDTAPLQPFPINLGADGLSWVGIGGGSIYVWQDEAISVVAHSIHQHLLRTAHHFCPLPGWTFRARMLLFSHTYLGRPGHCGGRGANWRLLRSLLARSIIDESAAGERCALQYLHLVEDDSRYELEETFETLLCSFLHTISVCGTRAFAAAATLPLERPQKFQNNKVPTFLQASPQCLLSSLSIIQHVVFVSWLLC